MLSAAWLDPSSGILEILRAITRDAASRLYWYRGAAVWLRGLLEVAKTGFVRRYPDLWGELRRATET